MAVPNVFALLDSLRRWLSEALLLHRVTAARLLTLSHVLLQNVMLRKFHVIFLALIYRRVYVSLFT